MAVNLKPEFNRFCREKKTGQLAICSAVEFLLKDLPIVEAPVGFASPNTTIPSASPIEKAESKADWISHGEFEGI